MLGLTLLALLCAPASAASVGRILHFSDVHLNISQSFSAADDARIPISYFQDAPLALLESALVYAKEHVVADPELFLYTGDHAAHGLFTDEYIAKAVEKNVHVMENYYPPKRHDGKLEVTAVVGNADGSTKAARGYLYMKRKTDVCLLLVMADPDYHMLVTDPEKETNPSIEIISEVWEDSLSAANLDLLNRRGFLSYALDDRLHVITLNTVPYSPSHVPDTSKQPDPFGQFAWLDKTLAELQDAGKFAYIAGHIAPIVDSYGGNPQWHTKYIVKYKNIVGKYADVIKAQFFGHVHSVEFRVPVTSLDGPTGEDDPFQLLPLYITGSISPLFGNNPSFMVWEYDTETYEVLDYAVYASYIAESDPQLDWKLLFKASEAYGLQSLSLSELSAFTQRVEQNVSLVEAYYLNMKARSPNARPCKDVACYAKTMCTLKWWTTKGEHLACVDTAEAMLADVVTASSGSSTSDTSFATKDVLTTIEATALATVVAVACVALTVYILQRAGVLKNRSQYDTIATL